MNSIQKKTPAISARRSFFEWYHTASLGQSLQQIEVSYLAASVQLTYNQTILQVGLLGSEESYLKEEFSRNFAIVADDTQKPCRFTLVNSDFKDLPVASESIDVLILPHVLEFEPHPHQTLREIERVLKPEGRLYILGFNPWGMRLLFRYLLRSKSSLPFSGRFIGPGRILDWLSLLKFDAEFSAGLSTSSSRRILMPTSFARRVRAHLSLAYAVKAVKRRYTLIPIRERWAPQNNLIPSQVLETPSCNQI
jgi:SAM-dependent methyltransferase